METEEDRRPQNSSQIVQPTVIDVFYEIPATALSNHLAIPLTFLTFIKESGFIRL